MPYIQLNDLELYYEEYGKGETVLFLHSHFSRGVPDDSAIILHNNEVEFYGDIFIVENRIINKVTI